MNAQEILHKIYRVCRIGDSEFISEGFIKYLLSLFSQFDFKVSVFFSLLNLYPIIFASNTHHIIHKMNQLTETYRMIPSLTIVHLEKNCRFSPIPSHVFFTGRCDSLGCWWWMFSYVILSVEYSGERIFGLWHSVQEISRVKK